LPGLEAAGGNGVEPRQHDAGGEGAIEHDMCEENARKAEGGIAEGEAEQRLAGPVDPAIAAPDREQSEGHHHAGGDDGGGEEANHQVATREAQTVEGPGEGRANDQGQDSGETRLDGGHAQQVRDIDARAAAFGAGGSGEDGPEHEGDEGGDCRGKGDGGCDAQGAVGQGQHENAPCCPNHRAAPPP
jgi:hypothetical protein